MFPSWAPPVTPASLGGLFQNYGRCFAYNCRGENGPAFALPAPRRLPTQAGAEECAPALAIGSASAATRTRGGVEHTLSGGAPRGAQRVALTGDDFRKSRGNP